MDVHQDVRGSSVERYNGDPTKAGTKRLFSNRTRASDREPDHGENGDVEDEEQHSGKRHRAADWPLPCATRSESTPARPPLRSRNAPNSPPSYHRPSSSQARSSRFLEGSMNDRVSYKPPTTYIGDEEARDRFEQEEYGDTRGRKMARPKNFMHHSNISSIGGSTADRSDISRHLGIFRFGKSLAASFNPSNWKIFNKPQDEIEETAQEKILRERREKAESIYQELKKTGHFRDSTFHPSLFQQREEEKDAIPTKHDSGVVLNDDRSRSRSRVSRVSTETPMEKKRMGRVFLDLSQVPTGNDSHYSQSPASTQDSRRKPKAKFQFKKPSLSNIRRSVSEAPSPAPNADSHNLRHVPSRKDLQKQQKLVKRVSDLEGKLDAARRQLAEVLDEPVPAGPPPRRGRTLFVPGALPSLPSERLLSGFCAPDEGLSESVSASQIGKALTRDESFTKEALLNGEKPAIEEPTRAAPPPPSLDQSLPRDLTTPTQDQPMRSVEDSEAESDLAHEPSVHSPFIQPTNARQVQIITTAATSSPSQQSFNSSSLLDVELDSDYHAPSSSKNSPSHTPSPPSAATSKPTKPLPKKESPNKASPNTKPAAKSKKRKSADDEKTFKPVPESESDISSLKPRRAAKKSSASTSNPSQPPWKLQKTSARSRHPSTPVKKPAMPSQPAQSTDTVQDPGTRQSTSPPPSGEFIGLEQSNWSQHRPSDAGADEDIPPVPKMPQSVTLPGGEVVTIPAQSAVASQKMAETKGRRASRKGSGSKLSKSRPSVSPRKSKGDEFEWPEDVF